MFWPGANFRGAKMACLGCEKEEEKVTGKVAPPPKLRLGDFPCGGVRAVTAVGDRKLSPTSVIMKREPGQAGLRSSQNPSQSVTERNTQLSSKSRYGLTPQANQHFSTHTPREVVT